ncbi:MAG: dihydrofolate reductase [Proteobacteria bacterium]|nr:dihydrofolate reductase [Pseudomonadota bacterium]
MEKISVTGIMACDPNGLIGAEDHMPWHYPRESQHFYNIIQDKSVIMGYNTYISTPQHLRTRPGNIVFSHLHIPSEVASGARFISSAEEFTNSFKTTSILDIHQQQGGSIRQLLESGNKEAVSSIQAHTTHYMIGGAQIFELFVRNRWLDIFILTHIKQQHTGDVWLDLSYLHGWKILQIADNPEFKVILYYNLASLADAEGAKNHI